MLTVKICEIFTTLFWGKFASFVQSYVARRAGFFHIGRERADKNSVYVAAIEQVVLNDQMRIAVSWL